MRKIDIWTVIMVVIVLLILAVLPAQASVGAQCCYTPAPEPTVGEGPCNSDTPWGCYPHRTYLPAVGALGRDIVIATPTITATATGTPAPTIPTVLATLTIFPIPTNEGEQ